jgi:thiol:disulfide interchange protein DsbD
VPSGLTKIASMSYRGYFGTFFMGLTLGIVAAPCVGPFILGLFTYVGHMGDPFLGFLYFFTLSIGMGLPLCVLAVFSGAMDRLPMSGEWMVWIRKLMGWVLIGMAAYFLCPLLPNPSIEHVLYAAVAIAGGAHLGWLDKTGRGLKRFTLIKRIIGIVIISLGIIYLASGFEKREGINWVKYPTIIHYATPDLRPVILDVYADFCLPCKELDKKVFHDPEVVKLSRMFLTIRLDLTKEPAFQDAFMRRYGLVGVPAVLFLNNKGVEERDLRIESFVDKSVFLDRMKKMLERSSAGH